MYVNFYFLHLPSLGLLLFLLLALFLEGNIDGTRLLTYRLASKWILVRPFRAQVEVWGQNSGWKVEVKRSDGSKRNLSPRHIVFCTGQAGEPVVPNFLEQGGSKGEIYHGSQHQDTSLSGDLEGKRVVIVGTGNSGHDIAQNFYENGSGVTRLQRRGTHAITAETGLFMLHNDMNDEGGPPTEGVDIAAQSLPIPVQFALNTSLIKRIAEAEKDTLDGLTKVRFALDFGCDRSGIFGNT